MRIFEHFKCYCSFWRPSLARRFSLYFLLFGRIQLEPGDILVGYTDGVTEARSPEDELFTRNRLRSIIEQPINSATELLERIKNNLFSFIDIAPRGDDVTMLAEQRLGNA